MDHACEQGGQRRPIFGIVEGIELASNPGSHDMEHRIHRSDEKVPAVCGRVAGRAVVELCCQIGPVKDPIASSVIRVRMRLMICGCL